MLSFLAMALVSGVVSKPVANMHSKPSGQAEVVSQAIYGSVVDIQEEQEGWMKVRTADEYTGWIEGSGLRKVESGRKPYSGRVARVESLFANLYQEPDVTRHRPVLTVPFETRLEVTSEKDPRWVQVRLVDDRTAWVQRGDVSFDAKPAPVAEMVAFSRRFLGLPYLWGGTSTFGYDCSGFTQMLYRRIGVLMPRDAQPQAQWNRLVEVEKRDLAPGDLLYFGTSVLKITHTGLYLGKGEFINATTHDKPVVQISRLTDPYWEKLFVTARRLK